jgi:ADP-heptose:LPS heptosyltransferase
MPPDCWQSVHRLVMICLDDLETVLQLASALQAVRSTLPDAHITLLTSYSNTHLMPLLPWVDKTLVHSTDGWKALETDASVGEVGKAFANRNPNGFENVLKLIKLIREQQFDAAIIFTGEERSPYALAYICYLAGVSIRLGQSQEFGGSVLSHCVKPPVNDIPPQNRHLFLLKSAGFNWEESTDEETSSHRLDNAHPTFLQSL